MAEVPNTSSSGAGSAARRSACPVEGEGESRRGAASRPRRTPPTPPRKGPAAAAAADAGRAITEDVGGSARAPARAGAQAQGRPLGRW